VVVGVDRLLAAHGAAEDFNGAVGDDFVGVHVGLCAGARLPDNEGEVVDELERCNLVSSLLDGLSKLGVYIALALCSLPLFRCTVPSPNFMLTVAAAPLRMPKARTMGGGMRSWGWLILKFSSERSVCAPQYLSDGTWISPKASLSVRVLAILVVTLNWRLWNWFVDWRVENLVVESGRVLRAQQNEGLLAFACASDRRAPASAARSFVALRNMVATVGGGTMR